MAVAMCEGFNACFRGVARLGECTLHPSILLLLSSAKSSPHAAWQVWGKKGEAAAAGGRGGEGKGRGHAFEHGGEEGILMYFRDLKKVPRGYHDVVVQKAGCSHANAPPQDLPLRAAQQHIRQEAESRGEVQARSTQEVAQSSAVDWAEEGEQSGTWRAGGKFVACLQKAGPPTDTA